MFHLLTLTHQPLHRCTTKPVSLLWEHDKTTMQHITICDVTISTENWTWNYTFWPRSCGRAHAPSLGRWSSPWVCHEACWSFLHGGAQLMSNNVQTLYSHLFWLRNFRLWWDVTQSCKICNFLKIPRVPDFEIVCGTGVNLDQSLEDTQVGYILQKYSLDKYTS